MFDVCGISVNLGNGKEVVREVKSTGGKVRKYCLVRIIKSAKCEFVKGA